MEQKLNLKVVKQGRILRDKEFMLQIELYMSEAAGKSQFEHKRMLPNPVVLDGTLTALRRQLSRTVKTQRSYS